MSQDEGGGGGATSCAIVVLASLLMFLCGGGAVLLVGVMFFARVSHDVQDGDASPVPSSAAQSGTITIQADGSLHWNDAPIDGGDLEARLDQIKNQPGLRRTIVIRLAAGAPADAPQEVIDLLLERQLSFFFEAPP